MADDSRVIARCPAAGLADGDIRQCHGDGGQVIAVYRQGGEFFATQDRCSHAIASLSEGWMEGHEVVCPVHEARFDVRTGQHKCFPATEPIETYEVQTAPDGDILVMEKLK
jgi:nitrite reductase/ring-hydroxylating ferredoxin subunit